MLWYFTMLCTHLHTQEAILSIGSAMTAIQFRDAVKFGLNLALPNVVRDTLFLLQLEIR